MSRKWVKRGGFGGKTLRIALLGKLGMHQLAQLHGQFVFHRVVNTLTVFATGENAAGGQQCEVLGDIGLGGSDSSHNIGHVPWFLANRLQNPQSHRLPQHLEPTGNPVQFLGGEKTSVVFL